MIRGVNRCILEVGGTGSKYFEKAILFVKPEYAGTFSGRLQSDAKEYLNYLDGDTALPAPAPSARTKKAVLRKKRTLRRLVLGVLFLLGMVGYTIFIKSL